jgi:hypothetical protein
VSLPDANFYDMQIERKCTKLGTDYSIYFEGLADVYEAFDLTDDL